MKQFIYKGENYIRIPVERSACGECAFVWHDCAEIFEAQNFPSCVEDFQYHIFKKIFPVRYIRFSPVHTWTQKMNRKVPAKIVLKTRKLFSVPVKGWEELFGVSPNSLNIRVVRF